MQLKGNHNWSELVLHYCSKTSKNKSEWKNWLRGLHFYKNINLFQKIPSQNQPQLLNFLGNQLNSKLIKKTPSLKNQDSPRKPWNQQTLFTSSITMRNFWYQETKKHKIDDKNATLITAVFINHNAYYGKNGTTTMQNGCVTTLEITQPKSWKVNLPMRTGFWTVILKLLFVKKHHTNL